MKRRVHRPDANQPEIVKALRKVGAIVKLVERPVDLLVGYRGNTWLMDVKNKDGRNRLTPAQDAFFDEWNGGPLLVVHTVEQAIEAISK